MTRRRRLSIIIAFHIIATCSWIAVVSRPIIPHDDHVPPHPGHIPTPSTSFDLKQTEYKEMAGEVWRQRTTTSSSRIGSRPPNCDHRCGGCSPCEAFQVPTTTTVDELRLRLHYTNYEPEGWKCKCGASFFNP